MIARKMQASRGVTLLELMIVFAIVLILALLMLPNILSTRPLRSLKADAMGIARHLKFAKMTAVSRNRDVGVFFNTGVAVVNGVDPGAYAVYVDTGGTSNEFDSSDPVLKKTSLRGMVSFSNLSCPKDTIIFSPNGSATAASGTVELKSSRGDVRKVIVAPFTGRIRIE